MTGNNESGHACKYEREFGTLLQKVKNIDKVLMGNGTKGVLRKVDEMSEILSKLVNYNQLKSWILRALVTFLFGFCMFLLGYKPIPT